MATSPFALHLSTTAPQASGYTRFRPPVISSSSSFKRKNGVRVMSLIDKGHKDGSVVGKPGLER